MTNITGISATLKLNLTKSLHNIALRGTSECKPTEMFNLPSLLLQEKQYPPPLSSDTISRPRLLALLDNTLNKNVKLTLVSAPAGSGKTTLLSQWCSFLENGQVPFAWLTLEDADNDPIRFYNYFTTIVEKVPGYQERYLSSSPTIQDKLPGGNGIKPEKLIDTLHSLPVSSRFIFVLDDYHWIKVETIHSLLIYLLNHLPPWAHVVVASRSDPPLGLSRLRSLGHLLEIRSEELNFAEDEVSKFLGQKKYRGVTSEQTIRLARQTEGWIAGLRLAALSIDKLATNNETEALSKFIINFGGNDRYLMDYLKEEVFASQPEEVQEFLLRTSILEKGCDRLCDVVAKKNSGLHGNGTNGGFSTSQEILEYLERQNLFIIPLDAHRNWYRYYTLFRDFLRWQLKKSLSEEEIACLYQQASLWSEDNGYIAEAIGYALNYKDYQRVIYLLDQFGLHLLAEAPVAFEERWIEELPKHLIESNPMLHVLPIVAQLAKGETLSEKNEAHLRAAEQFLSRQAKTKNQSKNASHSAIWGHVAIARASQGILQGEDPKKVIEHGKQALRELPEDAILSRHYVFMILYAAHMMLGELDLAAADLNDACRIAKFSQGMSGLYQIIFGQASIAYHKGMLREAESLCETAIQEDDHHSEQNETSGTSNHLVYLLLGQVLLQQNKLKEAQAAIQSGISGRWIKQHSLLSELAFTILARFPTGFHNMEDTTELIQGIAAKYHEAKRYLSACQASALLIETNRGNNKLDVVVQWAKSVQFELSDSPAFQSLMLWGEWRYFEQLTLARVMIAQRRVSGKPELKAVIKNFTALFRTTERLGLQGRCIEILILLALAANAEGDHRSAFTNLTSALKLAQPEGYVRVFLDEGETMRCMLEQLIDPQLSFLKNQISPDQRDFLRNYILALLAAFSQEQTGWSTMVDCTATDGTPWTPAIELLSEREVEIVILLSAGHSKSEIATQLFLSQNTIKAHVRNIYSKLGVHSRTQAIMKAREMGLPI